jgi:hypothetical protein
MAFLFDLVVEALFWLFTVQLTKWVDRPDPLHAGIRSDPYYQWLAR